METNIHPVIVDLQRELDSFKKERDGFNKFIKEVSKQLNEIQRKIELPEEFTKFKDQFSKQQAEWELLNLRFNSIYKELKNLQQVKENEIDKIFHNIECIKSELKLSNDGLKQEIDKTNDKLNSSYSVALNKSDSIKESCLNEVSKLKEEIHVSPKSILDSNDKILKRLEIASLDGQNAMMKINNLDLTVKMLERRVEQILTQIKNLELKLVKE